jgi:hypothetical protein
MFYFKNRISNDPYPWSKYLRAPFAENKDLQSCGIKHNQMIFVSSGGKFKLYTVPNGLGTFFNAYQLRFSFERMIP